MMNWWHIAYGMNNGDPCVEVGFRRWIVFTVVIDQGRRTATIGVTALGKMRVLKTIPVVGMVTCECHSGNSK
jgi:hypothetical protein